MENNIWKKDIVIYDENQMRNLRENLLNLVLETLKNQLYKDESFLNEKISYENYLDIKI